MQRIKRFLGLDADPIVPLVSGLTEAQAEVAKAGQPPAHPVMKRDRRPEGPAAPLVVTPPAHRSVHRVSTEYAPID